MPRTPDECSDVFVNGDVSFWYRDLPAPRRREPLPGSVDVDVCIVGAGFTGLWTAYYLKRLRPSLRVVLLEQEFAGFGASGRNGGWLTAALPGDVERYAATHGRDAATAMQRAWFETVDEVIDVAAREGIDADVVKGGNVEVATCEAQRFRVIEHVQRARATGWGVEDLCLLGPNELAERVAVAGALVGSWTPHCARVHPAKLVCGLADVVERLGVSVYEQTRVHRITPGMAESDHGTVRAPYVVRATEGFTARLDGERRTWLPMNSSMVVTEPLPAQVWSRIGWEGCETLGDAAHAYVYAQRTADDRIAIGGRGVPYRFGSRHDARGRTQDETVAALYEILVRLFPAVRHARLDHAWCGVLAVPRDWCASVDLDRRSGLAHAGGYVGHGVASTNLAGRTLADLVAGEDTERTRLPWVGRRVRRWEPEPLRWLGVHSMYRAYRLADRRERTGLRHTSRLASLADVVTRR